MLNAIIAFSLRYRSLVLLAALIITGLGLVTAGRLPVDVFPDLNRPTVTIMTEATGLAPEEVEAQVTIPLETALNGAPGVEKLRSVSGIGLSIIYSEFGWSTDVMRDRQVVQERLNQASERLPRGVIPVMTPVSSIMGEIMLIGVTGTADPLDLRDTAEWVIRPRMLAIPGIAQVTVMGGGLRQFQVMADPERLRRYDLTMEDLEKALRQADGSSGGGIIAKGSQEILVRTMGRATTLDQLAEALVTNRGAVAVRVKDVADVRFGAALKRGEGGVNGAPAVIMAVQKQPGADTRVLTDQIDAALSQLRLPAGTTLNAHLFRQRSFIDNAIANVQEAMRDGIILVVIVLILFLGNVRTTFITLTAIPLSLLTTALVFTWFGLSINTMTLGGIAVAIGELVDDAIVGVENILRRLRENRALAQPLPPLEVILTASSEVRNSVVFSTLVVLLVFIPLFALSGIEGRLFMPLGIAYIVSILASMLVSLTVTPALAAYLLPNSRVLDHSHDSYVLRACKMATAWIYRVTLPHPRWVIGTVIVMVVIAGFGVTRLGVEFLPPFNEGTSTISVIAPPGISMAESNRFGQQVERLILEVPEVKSVGRRTGRAEQDEHAEGVNSSEVDVDFWTTEEAKAGSTTQTDGARPIPAQVRDRHEVLADIRKRLEVVPGIFVNLGQPISHRLDHLLSGVRAQISVKISGPDLSTLRATAKQIESVMHGIPGVVDLQVEQQVMVPELRLRVRRDQAARYGMSAQAVTDLAATISGGNKVGSIVDGQRFYDLVLWTDQGIRRDEVELGNQPVVTPTGAHVLLKDLVDIRQETGPNQVVHDSGLRRIAVFCNVQGRDLGSTVTAIQQAVSEHLTIPTGYAVTYGGQFEAQRRATGTLLVLGALSMVAMFALLLAYFRSWQVVLQIMLNIPFAFIGAVPALMIGHLDFSVASLVGFISLTGIAARNGILLIAHYVHLMTEECLPFDRDLVIRGAQERVAPVLMTALTAGLALIPLVLAADQPGKEILHPVAVVILGGLATSTLLNFAVTPVIFLHFSGKAAAALVAQHCRERPATLPGAGAPVVAPEPEHPAVSSSAEPT